MTTGLRRGLRALGALTLGVAALHLLGLDWVARQTPSLPSSAETPARIEVAFVRDLAPAAPPPGGTAPAPVPVAPARAVSSMTTVVVETPIAALSSPALPSPADPPALEPKPVPAPETMAAPVAGPVPQPEPPSAPAAPSPAPASANAASASEPRATPPVVPEELDRRIAAERPVPMPSAAAPPASAGSALASARPAPAFEWPPSTRLSYHLVGDYRGPVQGSATVEWLRSGPRYQVHLDVRVGPEMTPLMSRRMSSDGEITPQGLRPRRYDELTRVLFSTRRRGITFEPDRVVLAGGGSAAPLPGLQDTASQFVQMTWFFNLQPQRLRVGDTLDMPLALPNRVSLWRYDVVAEETLTLPFGAVSTWALKPRPDSPVRNDLSVEVWIAPSLQYLPVRLRIRQDAEAVIDLTLSRPPQQAAQESPAAASPPRPASPP